MTRKLILIFIAIPVAVLLILFSVANRHSAQLILDPFNPDNPVLAFELPFFVFLFLAVLTGMVIGSVATWFKQGKHRKYGRKEHAEALKWQMEAEAQKKRAEELAVELHPELAKLPQSERAA